VHLGGGVARVGEQETAYPNRGSPYVMNVNGSWKNPEDDDANIAWVRETWNVLNPHSTGARYLNFEAEDSVQATYGVEKYERLAAVKAKYDPKNFFRFNQNIEPTVSGGRPL
jgi:FAD/FMN-containing dehydrogenase